MTESWSSRVIWWYLGLDGIKMMDMFLSLVVEAVTFCMIRICTFPISPLLQVKCCDHFLIMKCHLETMDSCDIIAKFLHHSVRCLLIHYQSRLWSWSRDFMVIPARGKCGWERNSCSRFLEVLFSISWIRDWKQNFLCDGLDAKLKNDESVIRRDSTCFHSKNLMLRRILPCALLWKETQKLLIGK